MRPALRAIRAVRKHNDAAMDISAEMQSLEPDDPRKHELHKRLLGRKLALWAALIGWSVGIDEGETLSDDEAQALLVAWAVEQSWRDS